jgi:hypothetical protein
MKRCPKCNRAYTTDTQKFCTHDGGVLVPGETPQADTVRIDSVQPDAPTKAISRELVSDAGKFDPYKTMVGQKGTASERTAGPRGRITQDLAPVEPPSSPEMSAPLPPLEPLPPQDSGTLPRPPPPPGQPVQALPPRSASGPIATPAPLPPQSTVSPQFPGAAQARQVQPLAAAAPNKKSKLFLVLGILAVLLVLGVGVLGAAYIFAIRPMLARRVAVIPTESPRPQTPKEPTPKLEPTPANTETPGATPQNEPPPYSPPADAVQFVNSSDNLDGKLAEHYVDFSFYYPERWQKDPKSGVPGATNFVQVERRLSPNYTQENCAVGWYASAGSADADRAAFPRLVENLSSKFEKTIGNYRKLSEGETKLGPYTGYEFRFDGLSQQTDRGQFKIWGVAVFVPPVDGSKNGVTLLMLATSLAPELRSIDDVGAKGELPMILESFRFGKKNSVLIRR